MENNEFKKVCIKNRTYYYFDDIIQSEDFDLDNILIDKKITLNYFDFWNSIWDFNWSKTFAC